MNKVKDFFYWYSVCALIIVNFLFIIFYLLLSYHNRFTLEGLEILISIQSKGLLGAIKYYYLDWGGSLTSLFYYYMFFGFVSSFGALTLSLFVYHILSILIMIGSVYYIITTLSNLYFTSSLSFIERINYSVFFCSLVFWGTFQVTDVWFWINSSFRYLQTILFTCIILALIIKVKTNPISYLIIVLCSLYIGAAFEIYAFILLCVCLLFLLMYNKKIVWLTDTSYGKKLLTAILFIVIGLIVMVSAPGNFVRLKFEAENFTESIGKPVTIQQNFQEIFNIIFQKKNITFFILMIVWFFTCKTQTGGFKKEINVKKFLLFLFLAFTIAVITSGIFFAFIFKKSYWPMRAWMPANFIFTCLLFFSLAILSSGINIRKFKTQYMFVLFSSISIIILVVYIFRQYPVVSAYSSAYDKRIKVLVQNKNNKMNNSILPEIPQPGMLVQTIVTEKEISRLNLK